MKHRNVITVLTTWLAVTVAPLAAQSAAVDPVTLAKYDANRDGRLDAAEITAMPPVEHGVSILEELVGG